MLSLTTFAVAQPAPEAPAKPAPQAPAKPAPEAPAKPAPPPSKEAKSAPSKDADSTKTPVSEAPPSEEAASEPAEGEASPEAEATAPDAGAAADAEAEESEGASAEAEEEAEPAADPKPEAAADPNEGRKSASANQSVEPPQDDYDGATDATLVEEKPRQKDLSLGVALDVTWPLGKTADFIGSASIQGLSLDLRYYAFGNIGIGAGVALDSLSKKTTGTAVWENATFTGTQVRELAYTPITLKGYYAWRDQERFIPYVAAGVGAARAVRRIVVGNSGLSDDSWHFALVPEAGLQIPTGPTMLLTNVRINYLPPSGGVDEQLFANFSFGLSIQ